MILALKITSLNKNYQKDKILLTGPCHKRLILPTSQIRKLNKISKTTIMMNKIIKTNMIMNSKTMITHHPKWKIRNPTIRKPHLKNILRSTSIEKILKLKKSRSLFTLKKTHLKRKSQFHLRNKNTTKRITKSKWAKRKNRKRRMLPISLIKRSCRKLKNFLPIEWRLKDILTNSSKEIYNKLKINSSLLQISRECS